MRIIILLLFQFILHPNGLFANEHLHSGLHFFSHEVNQDLRTSLHLNAEKPFHFPKGFSMDFDINFRSGDGDFGYVFRIISSSGANLDLVANLNAEQTNFWLVFKEETLLGYKWEDIGGTVLDQWIPIRISIDPLADAITLSINGRKNSIKHKFQVDEREVFEVFFGAHQSKKFVSVDVAPMKIRNLSITDHEGKITAYWKMDRHQEHAVLDEISGLKAVVRNPQWEIDKHLNWDKDLNIQLPNILGTVYGESHLYVIGAEEIQIIDLLNNTISSHQYQKGKPYSCRSNPFVFDPISNTIISYSFENSNTNILDLAKMEWSQNPGPCNLPKYWHHNKVLFGSELFTFGGYGFFTYNNILQHLNLDGKPWRVISANDQILPRYLSAAGQMDHEDWYIFGGYGSRSGAQQLAPKNYYDLHKINLKTGKSEKLWDLEGQVKSNFVPVDVLLPTIEKDGFYTLVYDHTRHQTYLKLAKVFLDGRGIEFIGDSIPYNFRDTHSWSSFYFEPNHEKLVAITVAGGNLDIYSLAFPPLIPEQTRQSPVQSNRVDNWQAVAMVLGFGIILILGFWIAKRKAGRKIEEDIKEDTGNEQIETVHIRRKDSALYFIGGFQAFDSEGQNITAEFTPTLKQLFLILFFYSSGDKKGITSIKLNEYIWPDKSESSAKNNRNVNISKLRLLLERIGNIEINNEEGYWKIKIGSDVYVDYHETLEIINQLNQKTSIPHHSVIRLINLLSYGELCPNMQTEWMDSIKVHFANLAIDTLFAIIEDGLITEHQYSLQLAVSDTLLIHDVLNEQALKNKCRTLIKMGKNGLAVQTYEKFTKEYEKLMGVPYDHKISEIQNW
jgi:two-component SAPR family response regulator